MMLKIVGPSIWIPLVMIAWGVVMMAMAAVTNGPGLLASRFFLGIAEAGLFPGVIFYLSMWYTRRTQASRISIFFGCSTLAGVSPRISLTKRQTLSVSHAKTNAYQTIRPLAVCLHTASCRWTASATCTAGNGFLSLKRSLPSFWPLAPISFCPISPRTPNVGCKPS